MNAPDTVTATGGELKNWYSNIGRAILLEALGDGCERISNRFKIDFEAYTQDRLNLETELETLKQEASRAQGLEDENIALKDEIKTLREANREQTRASSTATLREGKSAPRTPLAPKSINQPSSKRPSQVDIEKLTLPELRAEFLRIDKTHAKLYDKYINLQDALSKSKELLRERTTAYHQWVKHARQLNEQSLKRARRIKKLEAQLVEVSQEPLNLSFSSDAGVAEATAELEPDVLPLTHPNHSKEADANIPTPATTAQYPPNTLARTDDCRGPNTPLSADDSMKLPHQGVTLEEHGLPSILSLPPLPENRGSIEKGTRIKSEPLSDTPVIVSERSIRKRKYAHGNDSDIPASAKVKVEHSQSTQYTDSRRHFSPQESIDFDTELRSVMTPRKHTKLQRNHDVQPNDDVYVEEHDARSTDLIHLINHNDKSTSRPSTTNPQADSPSEFKPHVETPVQPFNNKRVTQPRSNFPPSATRRTPASTPRGIAGIAEDEHYNKNEQPQNGLNAAKPGVLEQLLSTRPPAQEDEALQIVSPNQNGRSLDDYLQLPKRRDLPFGKDGYKNKSLTFQGSPDTSSHKSVPTSPNPTRTQAVMKSRACTGTVEVPLRQIPKARLQLDDFKINPTVNEGYNYAFTDVVRKKDDRACLQGCVKDNCCGHKFRALAHACRARARPSEFQSLLESYLGDDRHQLSAMSESEKETLWIEAKMRELANANGRHRHRYPRMPTPPGFWRTDFPSTQEGNEYNEEAAKIEREIIEERHREAMRPGGLWIFRDE